MEVEVAWGEMGARTEKTLSESARGRHGAGSTCWTESKD